MKIMKTFMLMCVLFMLNGITVAAGNINEHEQRVLDTVSTPVTYNDKEYVAKETYVDRLAAYMNQNNVDLTKEQADTAIQKFKDNIETGIKEGYMEEVPSESEESSDEEKSTEEKPAKDKDKQNETPGDGNGTDSVKTDGQNAERNDSDNENDADSNEITEGSITETDVENNGSFNEEGADEIEGTENAELSSEEIARLQKERELVDSLIEKYSLAEEEADVYAELEAVESSMEAAKDYSDAEPFQKGISFETLAVIVAGVAVLIMAVIVLVHKSRMHKRK